MKACVVTTTRKADTNIGDKLIADRCAAMISDVAEDVTVTNLFHRWEWPRVEEHVAAADVVLIACLAIRRRIFSKTYRFIGELMASNTPICVVSAGISLGAFSTTGKPLSSLLTEEEADMLRALSRRSAFFSSRGYLTQAFLKEIGVTSTFAGDVAFYEPRFSSRTFRPLPRVTRIAVSDPHYAEEYRDSFMHLIAKLRSIFPAAQIDLLVHGHNDGIAAIAQRAGVPVIELYKEHGLDHYDTYDLHVGYRVHGHVSALARRKPSYLIEQDDRGTDYGATFTRRVSFASHRNVARGSQVLTSPIETLAAVLSQDAAQQFSRFLGFESEVEACGARNYEGVKAALASSH